MPKFYDIKLKDYIFSERFRNVSFTESIEFSDDFIVSSDNDIMLSEKAYFAWQKYKEYDLNMDFPSQEFVFNFELQLIEVLTDMESSGFNISIDKLKNIWKEIEDKIKILEEEIYELVGERFNLNSPKQLQVILFDKLNIPTTKKNKTWFSLDNEALEFIAQKYPIANMILEHRWLRKLLTTYIDWLLKVINKNTSKIHTTFNQTQTSTWRLSSENPNLQNIPSGNHFADMIKSCFIPSNEDYKIMVADYSQVELRILANLSCDENLISAFKAWEDIHMRTAKYLFWDKTISQEERRRAKTVNFGVIYWISGFGLSKQIWTSPSEATIYINKFFDMYSWVKKYYDDLLEKAREKGYVETYFGRRRYINTLNDANRIIRWQAEREACNMPIQWTSADIIKLAMIRIAKFLKENNYKSKMILQVHDELVFEIHKNELFLKEQIEDIMENVIPFEVKLLVESWIWDNWKDAKK